MISPSTSDLLFDDLALLQQHISHSQLMASSVNSNCDCSSAPTAFRFDCDCIGASALVANCDSVVAPTLTADCDSGSSLTHLHYDDRHTDQITQLIDTAH